MLVYNKQIIIQYARYVSCSWHTLIFVVVVFFIFFLAFLYVLMLVISLILSCLVLASLKNRHGKNIISFYLFLFITGRDKCYRASSVCGVTHVTVAALFCSSSLLCISNSDWATENEAGRSVSVNGNEEPAGEICHQYSSVVTEIIP